MPKLYSNKPVVLEVEQWTGSNAKVMLLFCNRCFITNKELFIVTLEGTKKASIGDYIIKGIENDFYPCKESIFNLTYNPVI